MSGLLAYDDALAALLKHVAPCAAETIAVDEGLGRVLAANIVAPRAQPPAAMSAMDGYAVSSADLSDGPWRLRVVGEIPAGGGFEGALAPGEAARIFTGGPMPDGADQVVIQENVERDGDAVTGAGGAEAGRHVRPAGVDFDAGQVLLRAGRVLSAVDLALIAAANCAQLNVRRRPRVAVFASGDELVEPGAALSGAAIVNSGSYGVAGLVAAWGGAAVRGAILPDDQAAVEKALAARAADCDVVVTIGGASVGDYDVVKPAAKALGAKMVFEKVAVKPGKPCWHARLADGTLFVGLPGNPASALVCAHLFLRPLVARLTGRTDNALSWIEATVGAVIPANGARESFLRGRIETGAGGFTVTADARQDSSLLTPFAAANVLIRRPPGAKEATSGERVPVLHLGS